MKLQIEQQDNATIVQIHGSVDMAGAERLREGLLDAATDAPGRVIVDLQHMTFINSLGLGALIAMFLQCRKDGKPLSLVSPQPKIVRMLELTRLTKIFDVCDSVEDALR